MDQRVIGEDGIERITRKDYQAKVPAQKEKQIQFSEFLTPGGAMPKILHANPAVRKKQIQQLKDAKKWGEN